MSVTINGTSGLVFNDASTQNTAATGFGFKNRIFNGNFTIDQRNAGASVTLSSSVSAYTLDRWKFNYSQTSKISTQQSTTSTAGFTNSLLVTSLAATSVGSSDYFQVSQLIEGLNVADLGWGAANAQPVTISFWVRSSLTGTFGGSLKNASQNRSYPFSYTINSANTYEYKTVTIAGDTTGTWGTGTGTGIEVVFSLGMGSNFSGTAGAWAAGNLSSVTGATSVVGTNGATFYITGVQLEKGSTATSFDYRPYGTELALCQRYFETGKLNYCVIAVFFSGSAGASPMTFKQTKRAIPTMTVSNRNLSPAGAIGSITGQNAYTSLDSNSFLFSVSSGAQNAVSIVELDYTASAEL